MLNAAVLFVSIISSFAAGACWEFARRGGSHDLLRENAHLHAELSRPPAPVIPLHRRSPGGAA